jgi:hypothetical protein
MPVGTVLTVTLRDEVRSRLAGRAGDVDAAEAGETESELADLPAELVGTAIGHFADTAPIAVADELSPIAMAAGPVPFDPELDGIEPVDDPLSAFGAVDLDPARLDDDGQRDAQDLDDPSDFDGFDSTAGVSDVGGATAADPSEAVDVDESFGSGSGAEASADPVEASAALIDDPLDLDAIPMTFVADEALDSVDIVSDEPVIDFDPVDLDTDEADPMGDDLDD